MGDMAIEVEHVVKRFGRTTVLQDLSFAVEAGKTYAFLGRNGAGKTTTIRMMLGLLRPDAGTIRLLGMDPARQSVAIRRRVGYLAEDQQMFGWMRVAEMISFLAPFYPTWDPALAADLLKRFELSSKTCIKHLSKGQNARLGLLLALAHRPELVILDDPTLGLDPIMRKQFLRDIVTYLQGEGVTVLFSSHLLYEVEPVADEVAILDCGRIIRQSPTDDLRAQVKQLVMLTADYKRLPELPHTLDVQPRGNQTAVTVECVEPALAAAEAAAVYPTVVELNLDEIFEAYVIRTNGQDHVATTDLERVA
ncbi:MAG TPA: ABC transporter ATP-binding protein [Phycisphaerae bacterium]|nr:ABC transporter ATP-binding protein [Phycisphaerae bacterium]